MEIAATAAITSVLSGLPPGTTGLLISHWINFTGRCYLKQQTAVYVVKQRGGFFFVFFLSQRAASAAQSLRTQSQNLLTFAFFAPIKELLLLHFKLLWEICL